MEDKKEIYEDLLRQIDGIIVKELPLAGNLCNILALLRKAFDHFWVGLYIKKGDKLLLGAFQGEAACTVIDWGAGVCGKAASTGQTVIVDDVNEFPGYIACHAEPRSEIVVPGFIHDKVAFVLDVDSIIPAFFNEIDKHYLENIVLLLAMLIKEKTGDL